MFRSILTLVLFVLVFCQSQADDDVEKLESCTAWGDPHVTRFPLNENEEVAEVWCQETGWKTLLENNYIKTDIQVGPKPYVITKFNLALFDDDHNGFCVLNEKQFLSAPEDCGPDVTISKDGNSLTIVDKKHDITVTIQKYDWNKQGYAHAYSIKILLPPYVKESSKGLCITSCDPDSGKALSRRRRALSNNDANSIQKSAEKICEISISKLVPEFKISSLHRMNVQTKNAYSACVTDVRLTGDLMFAKNSVATLAINLATKNLPVKSDVQKILNKAYALIKETNVRIDSALSQFVNSPSPSPSKDDNAVVFPEDEAVSISCRKTYAGVIKIVSASYDSLSSSCSMDATERVKELCASSPRLCKFNASNDVLKNNPCYGEAKQLKINYQCIGKN